MVKVACQQKIYTIRPRRRLDRQSKSLHYVNTMANQDHINLTSFSNKISPSKRIIFSEVTVICHIKADFGILIGRILVQYVAAFKALESVVTKHIKHKYYKEIAQESVVDSL